MKIHCPNCKTPMDLAAPGQEEILCSACGSRYRLDQAKTLSLSGPEPPRRLGKFELLEEVGSGGFGTVYRARDLELDRVVAVKVPHSGGGSGSPGSGDRFLREARSVARLRHPSIVPVHEVGQHQGVPFMVSEFVTGINLADWMTGGIPAPEEAARLISELADALQYAHEQGVIHRDVKPSNVMLEGSDRPAAVGTAGPPLRPRLMDFGLAKREAGEVTMTQEGQVIGTPAYMSPEQARGEGHRVDGRSDVYSLGVILYQLLTGSLPFEGNSRMMLYRLLHDEPRRPRAIARSVPRDLETICLKAMAKDRERRYATARDLADDLRRCLRGEPIRARPSGRLERTVKWARRRPAAAILLGLGALLVFGAASAAIWHWDAHLRLKVEHYVAVIKRWGVPEGIGPLSLDQARSRATTYRFFRRAGRVEKVESINGLGFLSDADNFPSLLGSGPRRAACSFEYHRNEEGELVEEIAHDAAETFLWAFHYTTRNTGHFADERGFPRQQGGSGVAYVEFVWSEDGLEKEVRYLDRYGKPRPDGEGVFGRSREHDGRGQVIAEVLRGRDGKPVTGRSGYARERRTYDQQGNLTAQGFFDPEDRPVLHRDGYSRLTHSYDERGNRIETRGLGLDGRLIDELLWRGSIGRQTFDARGNILEFSFPEVVGHPASMQGKLSVDDRGNNVEFVFLDAAGRPAKPWWAPAPRVRQAYDDRNRMVSWEFLDAEGRPVLDDVAGIFRGSRRYDIHGNLAEIAYFGVDGKPVVEKILGVARETMEYDAAGNRLETSNFGPDGRPAPDRDGAARRTSVYDDRGNVLETANFGVDGQPCADRQGVARLVSCYDEDGNLVKQVRLGLDGRPARGELGYATALFCYDAEGRQTTSTYLDPEDHPLKTRVVVKGEATSKSLVEVGLKPGDVLLTWDGHPITCARLLGNGPLAFDTDGKPKELRVLRSGGTVTLTFPPGSLELLPNLETRVEPGSP